MVNDILTLAFFPYLTGYTYNRLARWQRIAKTPSQTELTPTMITRLTQSITESERMELFRLRAGRLEKDELCAVDSTSRSAYGDSLADIKWGRNKDRLPLEQTLEVVVYSLDSHMPIYYRTFPGNIPEFPGALRRTQPTEPRRVPKGDSGHRQGIRVARQPGAVHTSQAADDHVRQGTPESGHGKDP